MSYGFDLRFGTFRTCLRNLTLKMWTTVNSLQFFCGVFFSMSIKRLNAKFYNEFKNLHFSQVYFVISRDISNFTDRAPRL